MIGMSSSSRNFEALGTYLVAGRSGTERDRVAWSTSRNLPTDDPELSAKIMRATAAQNVRVDKPVYHLALSFDPNDHVDRAAMERVADRVLVALQLQEHQAVIVAHKDREHAHVHLLVNRVHPETGRVWSRWQDQRIVQQVLREEERALGLRQVPGRLTREVESHETTPPSARAPGAENLPDEPPTRARHSHETVNELASSLRTYERVAEVTQLQYAARLDADAARARTAQLSSSFDRAHAAEEAFVGALREVYRVPEAAKVTFAAIATEQGAEVAVRTLRDTPEQLGLLLTVERRHALGVGVKIDDRPARAAAGYAAHLAGAASAAERDFLNVAAEARLRRLDDLARLGAEKARGTVATIDGANGVDAASGTPAATDERAASQQYANQAAERDRALSRELRGAPGLPELRDQIARTAERLLPHELRRLRSMVSAPQIALLTALRATVRDALLAREAERSA